MLTFYSYSIYIISIYVVVSKITENRLITKKKRRRKLRPYAIKIEKQNVKLGLPEFDHRD